VAEYGLRLLHLSDLHLGKAGADEAWRSRRVLGDAWLEHLEAIRADGRPIDLVCFTGDVAQSGQRPQYQLATEFFRETLERLHVDPSRFFVIPGNHDVDRTVNRAAWSGLRKKLRPEDGLDLARWLSGGPAPRGFSDSVRERLLARQAEFRRWLGDDWHRQDLLPQNSPHGRLGYRCTVDLPGLPFPVQVIGLDTAWLCGDDHDAGKLWLTDSQIMRLAADERGDPLPGWRLVLMHHPLTELVDGSQARRLLAERVDLVLRGHLHDPEPSMWSDPRRDLREAAAGCLYEHDRYPNGCQVIDVTLDDAGRALGYQVWFRTWSPRGHWFDDDGLYPETRGGRLTLWLGPRVPTAPSPALPVADVFVGRQDELRQLQRALLSGPVSGDTGPSPPCATAPVPPVLVCAVQGMPGIGKTYLAERFILEHGDGFPGGVLRLALETAVCPAAQLRDRLLEQMRVNVPEPHRWEALAGALCAPRRLVLVENVDTPEWGRTAAELAHRLGGCALLFTGRYSELGHSPGWVRVPVPAFEPDESTDQLRQELAGLNVLPDQSQLASLARELDGLPLALHLAAGYLRAGYSAERFLAKLAASGLRLEPHAPDDHTWRSRRASAVLHAAFEASWEAFCERLRAVLADLGTTGLDGYLDRLTDGFLSLGHAPRDGFGAGLGAALAGLDAGDWEEIYVAGRGLSLLQDLRDMPGRYRIHPLLAQWLAQRAESRPAARRATAIERLTDWFVDRLRERPAEQLDDQSQAWKEAQAEWAALLAWLPQVADQRMREVLENATRFAIRNGPFSAWLTFCERGLAISDDPAVRSNYLWTLGNVAHSAGELDRALQAAKDNAALDADRGAERGAALAWGNIADILEARGELDEALRIRREESLPVYERLGDVRERAITWGKIADILAARGELDEALRIRREEELPVYERLGDVRSRAITWGQIADILAARGELDEALRIRREESLPVFERLGDVRSRAITWGKIADILAARGELDEALRIRREEELPVYERLGDVRERAITWGKIADILAARGELDEALRIRREEELPVYERLGDVRSRAITWGQIADILAARGELDEALRIRREEELPVYVRLGATRDLLVGRANIAILLLRRGVPGDRDEAERLLRLALEPAERLRLPVAQQIRKILTDAGFSDQA
jgi:tetratricopeptide (TPR) repeat protein/calcineurin-like phosphoesterase family protein